jgi:murein DD-endopeptidase MepM/ murein hydrolase activator NlpD
MIPWNKFALQIVATSLLSLSVALILSAVRASAEHTPSWIWPVDGPRTVMRTYDAPVTEYSAGHRGIDIAAPVGQNVLAPADGVVHFAGTVVDRGVLSLKHGNLLSSFEPIEPLVTAGQLVRQGDIIGRVTAGHDCECLHVGARFNGAYLSPLSYLGKMDPAVLLPWD